METVNPNFNYVRICVKQIRRDENGVMYEEVVEKEVPDFVAEILTGQNADQKPNNLHTL